MGSGDERRQSLSPHCTIGDFPDSLDDVLNLWLDRVPYELRSKIVAVEDCLNTIGAIRCL